MYGQHQRIKNKQAGDYGEGGSNPAFCFLCGGIFSKKVIIVNLYRKPVFFILAFFLFIQFTVYVVHMPNELLINPVCIRTIKLDDVIKYLNRREPDNITPPARAELIRRRPFAAFKRDEGLDGFV